MQQLTHKQILAAFRNATKSEVGRVSFPLDYHDVDFSRREFYAWRDPKLPRRSYLVAEHDGELVALILNRAEAKPARRTMCAWCRDVELDRDSVLYTTRRAGAAGRRGSSIGVQVCDDFGCSRRVRKLPPAFHKGTDLEAIRAEQIESLRRRVDAFVAQALSVDD